MKKYAETAFRPASDGSVLMRVSDDGLRRTLLFASRDDARSFVAVVAPQPALDFAATADRWLVLSGAELHESRDEGATWHARALPGTSRVLALAGTSAWLASDRAVLVHDDASTAVRWRLPDPSPGGSRERVSSLLPLDGDHGLVCTDRAQIYFARPGQALLEPWSQGLPPPGSGFATYPVSRLGDVYFTGSALRRENDPTWSAVAAGIPGWAAHVAGIAAIEYSMWTAAPWAADTWIGCDPIRILEGSRGVAARWARPDTWTTFKPEPRTGAMSVYVGVARATPALAGIVVREHAVDIVPLPAGAYDAL